MLNQKIKFALAGCGYIGKRYIRILSEHPGCELTALIDNNADNLSGHDHLSVSRFQSLDDFFNSNDTADVLVVATPNGTHAIIAVQALQHKMHVLIEKPMALKKEDAQLIIDTAKKMNRQVMVVLQNRFSPVSQWLKELITSGKLGKIFFVEVNCFWNRDERYYKKGSWHGTAEMDGGSLYTQFSHFVDMVYWLFGDIRNINSHFANFIHEALTDFEDTGSIHFEFEQGGIGCFNFTTAAWDKSIESSLTILGECGSVKISGQYMDKIEHCHIKDYQTPLLDIPPDVAIQNHVRMIDAMIEAVNGKTSTNAGEALHSVCMIERMYAGNPQQQINQNI